MRPNTIRTFTYLGKTTAFDADANGLISVSLSFGPLAKAEYFAAKFTYADAVGWTEMMGWPVPPVPEMAVTR